MNENQYFGTAYQWATGWLDAQPAPTDDIERKARESDKTRFALAWQAYRDERKANGDGFVYILTAWQQWQQTGRISG